jgi:hypothetical protein
LVAHAKNFTVSDKPQGARNISNFGDSNTHSLHHTGSDAEINHVAHTQLVFKHHEKTVQNVFDNALCSKTEGCADDARARHQGGHRETQFLRAPE